MKFYGWRIALALAVTQTVGFGVLFYAYSVFTLPMETELGFTRAQTSGAFSMALLLSGLAAVPVGRWVDARGARLPMSVGSAAGALLLLLWSFVTTLPSLYLVQTAIGVVMALVLYETAFTVLATWFRHQRIRAMLLVTLVAALASTIFVPLTTLLVESVGWREALRWLALILAAVTLPLHAAVLRDHPRRLGLKPDGAPEVKEPEGGAPKPAAETPEHSVGPRQALRSGSFWWLSAAFALDRVVVVAIGAHSVPLLLERGYPPTLVAAAVGSIGVMQILGRLLFTPAADRGDLGRLAALTYVVRGAGLAALILAPGAFGLWLFAALFGVANGASTLARAGLVAEVYGPAYYGTINGAMSTIVGVAQTFAPLLVGAVRVGTGGYELALWGLTGVSVLAALAVMHGNRVRPGSEGRSLQLGG